MSADVIFQSSLLYNTMYVFTCPSPIRDYYVSIKYIIIV